MYTVTRFDKQDRALDCSVTDCWYTAFAWYYQDLRNGYFTTLGYRDNYRMMMLKN